MDPHFSAQDVPRCYLCETAIVHSYCDLCHVNLCKLCVVDHISDEEKHKIVPFKQRNPASTYPKGETRQEQGMKCFICSFYKSSKYVLPEYKYVFECIGHFPGECDIHFDENATPIVNAP